LAPLDMCARFKIQGASSQGARVSGESPGASVRALIQGLARQTNCGQNRQSEHLPARHGPLPSCHRCSAPFDPSPGPSSKQELGPGLGLGNERRRLDWRRTRDPQPRDELASGRNWDPIRMAFPTSVPEQEHGPSVGLGDERDGLDRRPPRERKSRTELARDRNRRGRFRHPSSERERPDLDLRNEWKRDSRRRPGQP
jgi:hypothetical protein